MKRRLVPLLLMLSLLLSGCMSWMDGSYSSVNLHTQRQPQEQDQSILVSTYQALRNSLEDVVENGREAALINVSQLEQTRVDEYMQHAVEYAMTHNPIGAYAVEQITYELGTSGGQPAVAVSVTYNSNQAEIRRIKQASGMDEVRGQIMDALNQCESRIAVLVSNYRSLDFVQFVEDYADANPSMVMEIPQVTVSTYPESGASRVLEISFAYQNSRDSLRSMQTWVRSLFTSAELYASGNIADHDKYARLFAFLMERSEYQIDTSMTPAYSLLVHGVGDSKAFATVYSAMCRRAGMECMVVSGTCNAEPLFWNIICDDGVYYHVDLLASNGAGELQLRTDAEMNGYVWDYSAYPKCDKPTQTEPTE